MKTFKKIMALVIAMVMVVAMGITAFADDPDPANPPAQQTEETTEATTEAVPTSQTIATNSAADADGKYQISVASSDTHTYKVYQILTGTLIAGESKLGNPAWGSDAAATTTYATVNDFITAITASGLSNQEINAIAGAVLKENAAGVGTVDKDNTLDVVPGYYLLVDTTASLEDGDAKSLNIVAVFNDIEITPKKGTVESEKHVDDQNDSDSTDHSELKDSADYDIGDSVPYTLTMTLPADYTSYKQYYVAFSDDMSAGLTYNGDAKIYYGAADKTGTDIGTAFAVDTTATSDYTTPSAGKVYKYSIADLKAGTDAQKALKAGDVITIKYTATLNSNAVIGSAGNPNKYKVDFSSNPNQDAGGTPETNETPWDMNIVFTYKTVFNKVDPENNPLTGADFKLEKKVGNAWVDVTALHTGTGAANPTKTTNATAAVPAVGTEGEDGYVPAKPATAATSFTFAGLDAGDYKLTETATPAGYNTIDPIEFTITATHELESDNPALKTLTGDDGAEFEMTAVTTGDGENKKPTGELTADIVNNQGNVLPSTGGIGTTIFYVVGAILVLGAGIILVTKRRMSAN